MHERGRRAGALDLRACTPRPRFCATTSCAAGSSTATAGLTLSTRQRLFGVPEVRQAVGATAKPKAQIPRPKRRAVPTARSGRAGLDAPMFSLHIDTARTWRGGQSQVMYTVHGPARDRPARGARGASRRRAAPAHVGRDGPDSARAAQRGRPGGRLAAVARPQAAAARRRPRARSARGGDGRRRRSRSRRRRRGRRWSRRGASSSASRTTRSRAGSTRRSTASSPTAAAIRDRLVADGIPRAKIDDRERGRGRRAHRARCPAANVHAAFYLPTHAPVVGNVAALVAAQGPASPHRRGRARRQARCRTRAS